MVRRSMLFSPGDRPELLRKSPESNADTLVFDLEDAVGSEQKDDARAAIGSVLASQEFEPTAEVAVRLNSGSAVTSDLEALVDAPPDAAMAPKVSDKSDVEHVSELLADRGLGCELFALIESTQGVLRAPEIAAHPAVTALIFGAEDFAVDIGATRTDEGTEVLYARERIVVAAKAADIDAIDTVYTDFEDTAGLREDSRFARELGFDGKLAIHPDQVEIINRAFTPDDDQIAWARRILEAHKSADLDHDGVFEVDSEMIDPPLLAQARRILEQADTDDDQS